MELLHARLDRCSLCSSLLFSRSGVSLGSRVDGDLLVLLADRLDCLQSLLDLVLSLLSSCSLLLSIQLLDLIIVLFGRFNNVISVLLLEEQSDFLLLTSLFVGLTLLLEDFVHFLGQSRDDHLV